MVAKTIELYLYINNRVKKHVTLSMKLEYLTTTSRMYYV